MMATSSAKNDEEPIISRSRSRYYIMESRRTRSYIKVVGNKYQPVDLNTVLQILDKLIQGLR